MPTIITPAELAARAAAVRADRENNATAKKSGKRAKKAQRDESPVAPAAPTPAPTPAPAVVATGSKAKIIDTLSPDALRAQIDALLSRLRAETNADAKKKIRRALRLRGHRGGLSHERAAAAAEMTDTNGAEGG